MNGRRQDWPGSG